MDTVPSIVQIPMHVEVPTGPAFKALTTDLQRNFVLAYCANGEKDAAAAYRAAGGEGAHSKTIAHNLLQNPKVQAAIVELCRERVVALLPWALTQAVEIAGNPQHKDSARMVLALMGRAGLGEQIIHKHEVGDSFQNVLQQLRQLATERKQHPRQLMGDAFYRLPKEEQEAIDAEFTDIDPFDAKKFI
jgi:hypothetical protein